MVRIVGKLIREGSSEVKTAFEDVECSFLKLSGSDGE